MDDRYNGQKITFGISLFFPLNRDIEYKDKNIDNFSQQLIVNLTLTLSALDSQWLKLNKPYRFHSLPALVILSFNSFAYK